MRHAVLSILIAASALTAILFVAILLPKANFASSPQGESSNLSQSASKSSSVNGKSDDITYVPNPESVAVDLYLYINKIDNYPLNASWVHPVKLSDNELSEYPVLGDGIKNIPVDSQPGTGYYYISSSTTPRLTSANATQLLNAIKNLGLRQTNSDKSRTG